MNKNITSWIGKKVCYFNYKEYHGFIPKGVGTVIEETDEECLIRSGFRKFWKVKDNKTHSSGEIVGIAKILLQ